MTHSPKQAGEHTRGPWIFEPHGGFGSGISDTGSIIKATNPRCVDPFPFGYISTAHPSPIFALEPITSNGAEEMLANAHLIAAAPELYEALAWVTTALEMAESDDPDEYADKAVAFARAALSKARPSNRGEA